MIFIMSDFSDRVIEIQKEYGVSVDKASKMARKEHYLSEIAKAKFLKENGQDDEAFKTVLNILIYVVSK